MIATESGTPIIKVVFLGDPNAGKTTLLYTWCNIPIEKVGANYSETIEPLTLSRVINQNCMIEYWDVGGNNYTRTPEDQRKRLLKGVDFVFIVYDTNSRDSFESATSSWYAEARKLVDNSNIMFIGTKTDVIGQRAIPLKVVEEFALRSKIYFMEVSNKLRTNIDLMYRILVIRISHYLSLLNIKQIESNSRNQSPRSDASQTMRRLDFNRKSLSTSPSINHDVGDVMSPDDSLRSPLPTPKNMNSYSYAPIENGRLASDTQSELSDRPRRRNSKENSSFLTSFQRTKDGSMVPVVETELRANSPKSTRKEQHRSVPNTSSLDSTLGTITSTTKKEPNIFIDIDIGDGRIGQIGVCHGDNVFQLAEQFVKKNHLPPSKLNDVAYVIRTSLNKYMSKQMEEENPRPDAKARAPLLKLKINLPRGKHGLVVVRHGDDPDVLAKNFATTFQLKKEMVDQIAEEIRSQLRKLSARRADFDDESVVDSSLVINSTAAMKQSDQQIFDFERHKQLQQNQNSTVITTVTTTTTTTSPTKIAPPSNYSQLTRLDNHNSNSNEEEAYRGHVLFSMEVEITKNNKKMLEVRSGEHPNQIARRFAQTYNLTAEKEKQLEDLINRYLARQARRKK